MSGRHSKSIQAVFTAGVGLLLSSVGMIALQNSEWVQVVPGAVSILAPLLALLGISAFARFNDDPRLITYRARLRRDLTAQKKHLKDELLSQPARAELQVKYEKTVQLLATANQDFHNGKVHLDTIEHSIAE